VGCKARTDVLAPFTQVEGRRKISLLTLPLNTTSHNKIKGDKRIGPHSIDIISIIFGSLLGEGDVERKKDGTRITFFQEAMHVKYLL
jgi:hypothetical protein